jgi:hypothetical protein
MVGIHFCEFRLFFWTVNIASISIVAIHRVFFRFVYQKIFTLFVREFSAYLLYIVRRHVLEHFPNLVPTHVCGTFLVSIERCFAS